MVIAIIKLIVFIYLAIISWQGFGLAEEVLNSESSGDAQAGSHKAEHADAAEHSATRQQEKHKPTIPKVKLPKLGSFGEKIAKVNKKQLLILALIFLLAFGVRGHMLKHELFFEFDTYWHARMTSYVIQDGVLPEFDPLANYQKGGAPIPTEPIGFWYINAAIYKIFTLGAPYNKELWIGFVKVLPAIYGALIAISMFFLFRKIYGTRAGYLAAFFTAVSSGFVYRTMAGWYEGAAMMFLWFVLGFFFFARAVKNPELKKSNLINAVIAGLVLGVAPFIGGWFLIIPFVLIPYFITMLILMWLRNEDLAKVKAFVGIFAITFIIFITILTIHVGPGWTNSMTGYLVKYPPFSMLAPQAPAAVATETGYTGGDVLARTVGEQSSGFPFFGTKYNAIILFMIIPTPGFFVPALPSLLFFLVPIALWRRRHDYLTLLIFFWAVMTMFMAVQRLQLTFAFGLGLAAAAAFCSNELIELFRNKDKIARLAVFGFVGFMMITAVGASIFFIMNHTPTIEEDTGWKDALKWMRENTPKDSKMFNWWDEGHWITFMGERGASTDNRNWDFEGDRDMALLVVTRDENIAYKLVKDYGSDYVVLSADLLMKQGSLSQYAYVTLDNSDPRIGNDPRFGQVMACNPEVSLSEGTTYVCGPNRIPENEFMQIPAAWQSTPNYVKEGQAPLFVYRNKDNTRFFMVNEGVNSSISGRLWFNDPSIEHFEEVYGYKDVKIFLVK